MAIRTFNFTPTQTKTIYDLVVERKHEVEELIKNMETDKTIKLKDLKLVKDYELTLKFILSQVEKKL
jgi:hypothetical protein